MGMPARSMRPLDAVAGHVELAYSVVEGAEPAPAIGEVASSWQRSASQYRVDPADGRAPRILTPRELKESREPLDRLILSAQDEIDQLYKVVREA